MDHPEVLDKCSTGLYLKENIKVSPSRFLKLAFVVITSNPRIFLVPAGYNVASEITLLLPG